MFNRVHPLFPLFALVAVTSGCTPSTAQCFAPGTVFPERQAALANRDMGQSARDLIAALFDRDYDAAKALLDQDRTIARQPIGRDADVLILALATCEPRFVDLLLERGAPADGARAGAPLIMALRANEPWYAQRLLAAGATPNPADDPLGPMRTAIALNSAGGVRLLLDHGANVDAMERTGTRALHIALDMERFQIAELLLERHADPWAIDSGGANLGSAVAEGMLTKSPADEAAQRRLSQRVQAIGWPQPAPHPRELRHLAFSGEWPPAAARGRGAPAVPAQVMKIISDNIVKH